MDRKLGPVSRVIGNSPTPLLPLRLRREHAEARIGRTCICVSPPVVLLVSTTGARCGLTKGGSAKVTEKARAKAICVVGAQWGDEGKGKVVDYLAQSFDYTARYAGGHNAGHTVIFDNHKYVLQLIPSGILRPGKKAVIGAGTVVDPAALLVELENLAKSDIEVRGRLFLSNRAHLIFPYHREMDKAAEAARGAAAIGTTSRGIGPAYEDKMARRGIRVGDLLDAEHFREKLERVITEKDAISRASYGHPLETAGIYDQ